MSDERLIDYATGNNNLTSNKLHEFENFIKQNKQDFRNLIFINISKPLSENCLLYTSPSPRDQRGSRMPSSA